MAVRTKTPAEEVLKGPIKSKTIFPVLILHLLSQGPEHGLALLQRIEAVTSGLLGVNTNTIYPLLRRLEERGFIAGEWNHPTKRARRLYRLTSAGKMRLDRIKADMLPYLDAIAASVDRMRHELYGEPVGAVRRSGRQAPARTDAVRPATRAAAPRTPGGGTHSKAKSGEFPR